MVKSPESYNKNTVFRNRGYCPGIPYFTFGKLYDSAVKIRQRIPYLHTVGPCHIGGIGNE